MKLNRLIILILLTITMTQAYPRRHRYCYPRRVYYPYRSIYAPRYTPYYSPYWNPGYSSSRIVTTKSVTTYPKNLIRITAESTADDITNLHNLLQRGLITEKDFDRAKKTLLNRIGMSINPDADELSVEMIISQIETLYHMQSGDLLTKKEYLKQKNRLLASI